MRDRTAIFLINLVQDVNIVRPLVFMAARDFNLSVLLLVSTKFTGRDLFGIWQAELEQLCFETGARLEFFGSDWEARQHLIGGGLIFAASESHLHNHVTTHSVFRYAPQSFLRVTLQHGFECVGFRHSAEHVRAHGATASFGADVVCAWFGPEHAMSMASSQFQKLLVTGPTALLQMHQGSLERDPAKRGIVCENLHSVRLNGSRDLKSEFVHAFTEFCRRLEAEDREVFLRPHPGGQYLMKNKVDLPRNARINNAPLYRIDLRRFAYGISAPSSVLIDMLLADIPTAVWRDRQHDLDTGTYAGLTTISAPDEWLRFALEATTDPAPFITRQRDFLAKSGLILDPGEIFSRYAELFRAAQRMELRPPGFVAERERLLYVANARVPTLQLSFEKPLADLTSRGEFTAELLTEPYLRDKGLVDGSEAVGQQIDRLLDSYDPTLVVFCRYSGPGYAQIIEWAHRNDVPVIYHIDDDLLAVPRDIGELKFEAHNAQARIAAVRFLLANADLVYASTERLQRRLLESIPDSPVIAGKIYCSGKILRRAEAKTTCTVGYMASADHAHNLQMVLPAIAQLLERNPHVRFELFGSIPRPPSLDGFGERVSIAPPIADYGRFLSEFAQYGWDIGICPLVPIDFNLMKANTKWVEYSSVGAAVVASRGTVYDECCADGCGILAGSVDEWLAGLELLVNETDERLAMVARAQEKLRRDYNIGQLREQVLEVFDQARSAVAARVASHDEECAVV